MEYEQHATWTLLQCTEKLQTTDTPECFKIQIQHLHGTWKKYGKTWNHPWQSKQPFVLPCCVAENKGYFQDLGHTKEDCQGDGTENAAMWVCATMFCCKIVFFHCMGQKLHWCCSFIKLCLRDPIDCSMPGPLSFPSSQNLSKFMCVALVTLSHHLILCCPPFLLLSVFTSIKVSSKKSFLLKMRPKYLSISFSTSPSHEYHISGAILTNLG